MRFCVTTDVHGALVGLGGIRYMGPHRTFWSIGRAGIHGSVPDFYIPLACRPVYAIQQSSNRLICIVTWRIMPCELQIERCVFLDCAKLMLSHISARCRITAHHYTSAGGIALVIFLECT